MTNKNNSCFGQGNINQSYYIINLLTADRLTLSSLCLRLRWQRVEASVFFLSQVFTSAQGDSWHVTKPSLHIHPCTLRARTLAGRTDEYGTHQLEVNEKQE